MFFHTQLCPRLEEALVTGTGKSNNVHGKLTIKLTGIVKCTDTMCTGILMAACYYMLCGQQRIQQPVQGQAAAESHPCDYS